MRKRGNLVGVKLFQVGEVRLPGLEITPANPRICVRNPVSMSRIALMSLASVGIFIIKSISSLQLNCRYLEAVFFVHRKKSECIFQQGINSPVVSHP